VKNASVISKNGKMSSRKIDATQILNPSVLKDYITTAG
jgi:hypothetical protein